MVVINANLQKALRARLWQPTKWGKKLLKIADSISY